MDPAELKLRARELKGQKIYVIFRRPRGELGAAEGEFISFFGDRVRLLTPERRKAIPAWGLVAAFLAEGEEKNER